MHRGWPGDEKKVGNMLMNANGEGVKDFLRVNLEM